MALLPRHHPRHHPRHLVPEPPLDLARPFLSLPPQLACLQDGSTTAVILKGRTAEPLASSSLVALATLSKVASKPVLDWAIQWQEWSTQPNASVISSSTMVPLPLPSLNAPCPVLEIISRCVVAQISSIFITPETLQPTKHQVLKRLIFLAHGSIKVAILTMSTIRGRYSGKVF